MIRTSEGEKRVSYFFRFPQTEKSRDNFSRTRPPKPEPDAGLPMQRVGYGARAKGLAWQSNFEESDHRMSNSETDPVLRAISQQFLVPMMEGKQGERVRDGTFDDAFQ